MGLCSLFLEVFLKHMWKQPAISPYLQQNVNRCDFPQEKSLANEEEIDLNV